MSITMSLNDFLQLESKHQKECSLEEQTIQHYRLAAKHHNLNCAATFSLAWELDPSIHIDDLVKVLESNINRRILNHAHIKYGKRLCSLYTIEGEGLSHTRSHIHLALELPTWVDCDEKYKKIESKIKAAWIDSVGSKYAGNIVFKHTIDEGWISYIIKGVFTGGSVISQHCHLPKIQRSNETYIKKVIHRLLTWRKSK